MSAVADPKEIEISDLKQKLKRSKEIVVEKSTEEMRKWAQEKEYYKRSKELSETEKVVFDVMILKNCSNKFLETQGLEKWGSKSDFVDFVKKNQSDRNKWYRDFIRENLSSNDVNFRDYLKQCQTLIFSEQYPDEYNALAKKYMESYAKKQQNIIEKLKELGVENIEEA